MPYAEDKVYIPLTSLSQIQNYKPTELKIIIDATST